MATDRGDYEDTGKAWRTASERLVLARVRFHEAEDALNQAIKLGLSACHGWKRVVQAAEVQVTIGEMVNR